MVRRGYPWTKDVHPMKMTLGSIASPFVSSCARTWPDFSAEVSSNSRSVIVDRNPFTEARFTLALFDL